MKKFMFFKNVCKFSCRGNNKWDDPLEMEQMEVLASPIIMLVFFLLAIQTIQKEIRLPIIMPVTNAIST